MFLSLGLGVLIALEMLLISGGVLGAIPLSGVVSPFLSSGTQRCWPIFYFRRGARDLQPAAARRRQSGAAVPQAGARRGSDPGRSCVDLSLPGGVFPGTSRSRIRGPRRACDRRRRSEACPIQSAAELARARDPAARFSTATESLWRSATGASWKRIAPTTRSSECRSTTPARELRPVTIRSARRRLICSAIWDRRQLPRFECVAGGARFERDAAGIYGSSRARRAGSLSPSAVPSGDARAARKGSRRPHHHRYPASASGRELLRERLEPAEKRSGGGDGPAYRRRAGSRQFSSPQPHSPASPDELFDRARYGQYPPGSTFKLVTAIAALRLDPDLRNRTYQCVRMRDGRAGNVVTGWNKPIRDDVGDHAHGTLDMERALTVSCNAYFAQLGTYDVGAKALHETADLLEIPAGEISEIQKMMPFAAYGQGPVLVTPFKMARVAATIAAGGAMPQGRWIMGDANLEKICPVRSFRWSLRTFCRVRCVWWWRAGPAGSRCGDWMSPLRARQEPRRWKRARRIPGSPDLLPSAAIRRSKLHSRWWWSTADTARSSRLRSRAKSSKRHVISESFER